MLLFSIGSSPDSSYTILILPLGLYKSHKQVQLMQLVQQVYDTRTLQKMITIKEGTISCTYHEN